MGGADGDRQTSSDDPVGAQHADRKIGDVHGTALAAAAAALAPEQLQHHGLGIRTLGDGVAVTAVGGGDLVVEREIGANAGGDRLLTDREMDRAADQAVLLRRLGRLLEGTDALHGLKLPQQACPIRVAAVFRHRHPP